MKTFVLLASIVALSATTSALLAPPIPADIGPAAVVRTDVQGGEGAPRDVTLACPPARLHVLVHDAQEARILSALFWEVGIPPGSKVTFYHGDEADAHASADAAATGGVLVVAPATADAAWARAQIAC